MISCALSLTRGCYLPSRTGRHSPATGVPPSLTHLIVSLSLTTSAFRMFSQTAAAPFVTSCMEGRTDLLLSYLAEHKYRQPTKTSDVYARSTFATKNLLSVLPLAGRRTKRKCQTTPTLSSASAILSDSPSSSSSSSEDDSKPNTKRRDPPPTPATPGEEEEEAPYRKVLLLEPSPSLPSRPQRPPVSSFQRRLRRCRHCTSSPPLPCKSTWRDKSGVRMKCPGPLKPRD